VLYATRAANSSAPLCPALLGPSVKNAPWNDKVRDTRGSKGQSTVLVMSASRDGTYWWAPPRGGLGHGLSCCLRAVCGVEP
jgi:hypothetical protein